MCSIVCVITLASCNFYNLAIEKYMTHSILFLRRLLFWVEGSDPATARIMRTSLNASSHTTGPSVVLANVSSPRDLTVDVVRDMLYWIAGGGTIGRATFEGTSFKQIPLSEGLAPVSIAVFEHFLYVLLEDGIARINLIAGEK